MNVMRLGFLGAVLVCWVSQAPAGQDLPPAAEEVLKQSEQELVEAEKKIEEEGKKCRERMAGELKKIQDQFCKEAKLDEAVAVRDLIRSVQAGNRPVLGSEVPAAAREVCKQHEDELAEIVKKAEAEAAKRRDKITGELKKIQDQFCKEAKLDEAVAVRDLIRAIRENGGAALPDPGSVGGAAGDIGKVFYYDVTGINVGQGTWGTDVYTTGSHLGLTAVHSGVLQNGQRGIVKVTILPGREAYGSSTRNGITSQPYGPWGVSFKVERVIGFVVKRPIKGQP